MAAPGHPTVGLDHDRNAVGQTGLMRGLPSRVSEWVLAHPVLWVVTSALVLVLLGLALELAPIVIVAAGAVIGGLNVLHARRRGYCPVPTEPGREGDRA
jgi:hypothetical protein